MKTPSLPANLKLSTEMRAMCISFSGCVFRSTGPARQPALRKPTAYGSSMLLVGEATQLVSPIAYSASRDAISRYTLLEDAGSTSPALNGLSNASVRWIVNANLNSKLLAISPPPAPNGTVLICPLLARIRRGDSQMHKTFRGTVAAVLSLPVTINLP